MCSLCRPKIYSCLWQTFCQTKCVVTALSWAQLLLISLVYRGKSFSSLIKTKSMLATVSSALSFYQNKSQTAGTSRAQNWPPLLLLLFQRPAEPRLPYLPHVSLGCLGLGDLFRVIFTIRGSITNMERSKSTCAHVIGPWPLLARWRRESRLQPPSFVRGVWAFNYLALTYLIDAEEPHFCTSCGTIPASRFHA